eukprot:gnl/MRDRNA2_/MRDRNA2_17010_c0_seq1.p1 gnl/MRDRNA2_/MRDRNA2_17010_c0~~gnl/MRDRNA2_/MRDRNA2_17010_c0_seq1.p1  ORF type:complete len:325 (-),score=65.03 gnl/MRDRNA2_/MRDRNA2_17010_c0_seq1:77-919(-)
MYAEVITDVQSHLERIGQFLRADDVREMQPASYHFQPLRFCNVRDDKQDIEEKTLTGDDEVDYWRRKIWALSDVPSGDANLADDICSDDFDVGFPRQTSSESSAQPFVSLETFTRVQLELQQAWPGPSQPWPQLRGSKTNVQLASKRLHLAAVPSSVKELKSHQSHAQSPKVSRQQRMQRQDQVNDSWLARLDAWNMLTAHEFASDDAVVTTEPPTYTWADARHSIRTASGSNGPPADSSAKQEEDFWKARVRELSMPTKTRCAKEVMPRGWRRLGYLST